MLLRADLPVHYGEHISIVANMYGAKTHCEARRLSNDDGNLPPVVGYNPFYWVERANRAFNRAVSEDDHLRGMREQALNLQSIAPGSIKDSSLIGVPVLSAVLELDDAESAIRASLKKKEQTTRFVIVGKWVNRTLAVSSFAQKVIGTDGSLSRALPEDTIANTTDYWQSVIDQVVETTKVNCT